MTLMKPPPITADVRKAGPVPVADTGPVLRPAAVPPRRIAVDTAREP
jgi:hypothetical protein